MKICVISDLHCKYQQKIDDYSDTLLISNKPRIPKNQHPVAALLSLIKESAGKISADVLLCPGDLGDRADEQGINSAWAFLDEIKTALGAKILIGIPGNHDINSRRQLDKEPFAFIKNFHENFPVTEDILKNKFWDAGYNIIIHDDVLFLLINTVHDHVDTTKALQSSISIETLEKIKSELQQVQGKTLKNKVCVLHHHPIKHSNIQNWRDSDSIERGDELIALLNQHNFTITIHGHKHQPRIIEYNSLPIFAAGSFASFANLQATGYNTMYHLVTLTDNSKKGSIHSWEFDLINGWTHKQNRLFPPRIGFGCSIELEDIAAQLNELFTTGGRRPLFYDEALAKINDLNFLIPEKLVLLDKILKDKYKISVYPEFPIDPSKISEYLN